MLLSLLLTVLTLTAAQPITVDLQLLQYQPLTFRLTFSQPITLPPFQLLLNSYLVLTYDFLPDPPPSPAAIYRFTSYNSIPTTLENYSVQFMKPLGVGKGRLDLGSYVVQARKSGVTAMYSYGLGAVIVAAAYLLVYFTTLGHIVIEFLQIYCLYMYHDTQKTSLYQRIRLGMLMLNPNDIRSYGAGFTSDYVAMILPLLMIVLTGGLGWLLRRNFKGEMSLGRRIFYEVGVYNLFINAVVVFIFPLFFNSLQFFSLVREGAITDPSFRAVGTIAGYFSLILTLALLYMLAFAINPKWGESKESWRHYIMGESFDNYRKLYEGLILTSWAKRNKIIFTMLKRLLAALFFFWGDGFESTIFLLEFFTVYYVFTVRPYKEEIYLNAAVLCRLLVFHFYGMVVLGNIYFGFGDFTIKYDIVLRYLQTTLAVFLGIILFMFLFIFYEIYLRCRDLNYRIRLVKEENEYKIKLYERERRDSDCHSKRKGHRSMNWSDGNRSHHRSKENVEVPLSIHKSSIDLQPDHELQEKIRKPSQQKKKEAQESKGSVGSKHNIERGAQRFYSRKWNKESMLDEILKG